MFDDLQSISATLQQSYKAIHRVETGISYLGLQVATRKKQDGAWAPGNLTGAIRWSIPGLGVFTSFYQKKWDKVKQYLQEIRDEFMAADGEMPFSQPKIIGEQEGLIFVHLANAFPVLFPFLEGFHLVMNSWHHLREENGWKMSCCDHAVFMHESKGFRRSLL